MRFKEIAITEVEVDDDMVKKEYVTPDHFDEWIPNAKPTKYKIKGYQIYIVKPNYEDILLIKDPNTDGFLGELRLTQSKFAGGVAHVSNVFFARELQGKNVAVPLYQLAITQLNYNIVSDNRQSKGSKKLWNVLSKVPGVFVYAWDSKDDYFQWNPDEDPEEEIYGRDSDVNDLHTELNDYRTAVGEKIKAGELDLEKGQDLIKAKTFEIRKKTTELTRIMRSVRLVATSEKGLE